MLLKNLLQDIYNQPIDPRFTDFAITDLCDDSRHVKEGALFIAVKGVLSDGVDYVDKAIEQGAAVIVVNEIKEDWKKFSDVCFIQVEDTRSFLRLLVERYFDKPSQNINMIGITGTNGKTTISYLTESILHEAESSCSIVGTINYRIAERVLPANNTTPGLIQMQKLLSYIVEEGIENCVMEVSSHALDQGRVDLIDFDVAVFSNLTSDHLDYHKTRDNYFAAKAKLFTELSSDAHAIINIDDDHGRKLFSKTDAKIITYGIHNKADVMARDVQLDIENTQFKIAFPDGEISINSVLVGEYNVYNMLAAAAASYVQGINPDKIKKGIEHLKCVPGRLEKISLGQDYSIFIDYAHTEDALHNVMTAIRNTCDAKIICVFGCGGDRDASKRAKMGQVASTLADFTVVTSDNPRSENPQTIINQIVEGFETESYKTVVNREEGIREALAMAQTGDVVLIAGKGHEDYQVFKDQTIQFDEKSIIRNYILC